MTTTAELVQANHQHIPYRSVLRKELLLADEVVVSDVCRNNLF